MDSSRIERVEKNSLLHRDRTPEAQSLLAWERHIRDLISLGAPLSGILNTLCAALDVQMGDVVSLVLLSDEEEHDLHAIVHSAGDYGLYNFCSAAILSEGDVLLGTLEILCCDPRNPSASERQIIERMTHLAAIAIQSQNGSEDCRTCSHIN